MTKLSELWIKFLLWSGVLKLDYSLETCPMERQDDGSLVVNLTVEPRWFWKKRRSVPKLGD